MQTYLFYDIETTGLNKAFDQILQFAAIRTDLNLNEIDRYELKVKLNPDVIPSPYAVITHHIGVEESLLGVSEMDAIKQIHQWFNTPGTISLGYNSLGFDDEFLRFSFYRNLLAPYTHQYANLCGRMDLYPMSVMYYLFKNEVIEWPTLDNKLSLKLEALNTTNQWVTGRSHQAMVDVEATLALAKRFHADQSMWTYLSGHFNKQKDQLRLQQLKNEPGLMVSSYIGFANQYQCPVLSLGNHRHYKNQSIWLRLDSETLDQVDSATIKEHTHVTFKKMGEPSFILSLKDRFLQHLHPECVTLAKNNFSWLQKNPAILSQITQHYAEYLYPSYPQVDIQASLYLYGFWSEEENIFCRCFHASNPKEKAFLTENLKNPRLKTLAIRALGKYFPECLTPDQTESFHVYLQQINTKNNEGEWTDHRGEKRLTINNALNEIQKIRLEQTVTEHQQKLLIELEMYLKKKFEGS